MTIGDKESMTEAGLVAGLKSKDEAAVRALVDRYGDKLLRAAAAILGDVHQAEDVVQETFVSALRGIHRFRETSSLYTWLYRIAVNECRMARRRKHPVPVSQVPEPAHRPSPGSRNESSPSLTDALARLGYVYKEAIVLHYYLDMSVAEIAAVLQRPRGTVKARLSRGRAQLRSMLTEKPGKGAM